MKILILKRKINFIIEKKSICNKDKESLSIKCNSLSDESNIMGSLDGKNTNIREFGITKIYTTFHLFHNLKKYDDEPKYDKANNRKGHYK